MREKIVAYFFFTGRVKNARTNFKKRLETEKEKNKLMLIWSRFKSFRGEDLN